MRSMIENRKEYESKFSFSERSSAFLGAFVISLLLFAPVMVALIELTVVFIYRVNLMVFLFYIAFCGWTYAMGYFTRRALVFKNKEDINWTKIRKLFWNDWMFLAGFELLIALSFVFVWIPMLMV